MTWLSDVRQQFTTAVGGDRNANLIRAGVSLATGNPLGAVYYGIKGFNTPSQKGWGSAISKTPYTTTVQDFSNQIPSLASNLFTPSIPKGDYGTTVQDFSNTISAPSGSGLQMAQEPGTPQQAAPQAAAPQQAEQQAPAATQPRVTPTQMPVKSFEETFYNPLFANNAVDPSKAMTTNNGYFDMNKANTVGGHWIPGVGWYTEADKMAGKTEEDMAFNEQMRQRIASMYS